MGLEILGKQLNKFNLSSDELPQTLDQWNGFLNSVENYYIEHEQFLNKISAIQTQDIQKSKLAVLGELAAGVAHEINNPLMILTSVTFVIQKLIEQNRYEEIPEKLEKIQNTTSRISRIVNGLRMYARDGQKDPLLPKDIEELIEESLELCFENLRVKDIHIDFINYISEATLVNCRDTQISQVILNLISNAKDAVLELKNRWIKITLEKKNDNVIIKVIDSGSGIPQDIRDRIFQPFFTTKQVGNGTGLGLSISSGIISSHNGKLFVDDHHENTCFVIELPLYN